MYVYQEINVESKFQEKKKPVMLATMTELFHVEEILVLARNQLEMIMMSSAATLVQMELKMIPKECVSIKLCVLQILTQTEEA